MAMACDIRVVGNSARIGQPEVSLGIIPAAGGCFRLPKLIGIGKAREMIYTGRLVDAAEAADLGWANRLVDDAEVISTSTKIAEQIMANSNIAVSHAKSLISEALFVTLAVSLARLYHVQQNRSKSVRLGNRAFETVGIEELELKPSAFLSFGIDELCKMRTSFFFNDRWHCQGRPSRPKDSTMPLEASGYPHPSIIFGGNR